MTVEQLKVLVVEYYRARRESERMHGEHWRYPHQTLYDATDAANAAEDALLDAVGLPR